MAATTHLGSLQALELAIRKGSLKAAAEALNITPAAVGQRIKLLEDYLGVELLVRGRTGLRPTPALEAALGPLGAAFSELETAARLLDFQRVHELHLVADTDWADLWLKPRLPRFRAENPNTLFCINGVGDVPVRLGQADCEIWFGPSRDRGAEDELFRDYLLPVGAPDGLARISRLAEGQRLEGFPLVHLDCYAADPTALDWPGWVARFGQRTSVASRGPRYRTVVNALDPVSSMAGLIICGLSLVEELCAEGRLTTLFPLEQGAWTAEPYRMRFREGALRRSQTARFRDWLLDEARATTESLQVRLEHAKARL